MARKPQQPPPPGQPDPAFEAELARHLQERARLLLAGNTAVLEILKQARTQILATLAGLPPDWQQWHLSRLLGQLEDVLTGATAQAGALFEGRMHDAWSLGQSAVDAPLATIGHSLEGRLAQLDVRQLKSMQRFGSLRIKDVGQESDHKIGRQLGMATIGAQTPHQAIQAIQKLLGTESPRRAAMIVHTEMARAFATAGNQRLEQAAQIVPGLGKKWRRSGKIHSRWQHDIMDGQVAEAGKPFKVPSPGGGFDLMRHPHDPQAPASQNIHCGCVALPWMKDWQVSTPGAKPFTERELKLDGRKAALDQAAKRAELRREVHPQLPDADKAHIPMPKLTSYALNPDHPKGGHKARVLAAALGYTAADAPTLARQLLAGLPGQPATTGKLDQHGQRWTVDIPVTTPKGSATVRTGWIVRPGSDAPQLTSAYIEGKRK